MIMYNQLYIFQTNYTIPMINLFYYLTIKYNKIQSCFINKINSMHMYHQSNTPKYQINMPPHTPTRNYNYRQPQNIQQNTNDTLNPSRSKSSLNNRSNLTVSQKYVKENNNRMASNMYNRSIGQPNGQVLAVKVNRNVGYEEVQSRDKSKSINKNMNGFYKPSLTINVSQKENQYKGKFVKSSNQDFKPRHFKQEQKALQSKTYQRFQPKTHIYPAQEYEDPSQQENQVAFPNKNYEFSKSSHSNISSTTGMNRKSYAGNTNTQEYITDNEKRFQIDITSRKQNSYKQAIHSSMNNIQNINNQINDLLNLVRNDKFKGKRTQDKPSESVLNRTPSKGFKYTHNQAGSQQPFETKISRKTSTKNIYISDSNQKIGKIYQRQQRTPQKFQYYEEMFSKSPEISKNKSIPRIQQKQVKKYQQVKQNRSRIGQITHKKEKFQKQHLKNAELEEEYGYTNQMQKQTLKDQLKYSDKQRDQNIEQILSKYSKDKRRKTKADDTSQIGSSHLTKGSMNQRRYKEFNEFDQIQHKQQPKMCIIDHQIQKIKEKKQISEENNHNNQLKLKSYQKTQHKDYYETGKFKFTQNQSNVKKEKNISKVSEKEYIEQEARSIIQKYSVKKNLTKKDQIDENNTKKNEIGQIKKKYEKSKQIKQEPSNVQKIKLAKKLSHQIRLDLNMKKARQQFENISDQGEKWIDLNQKLQDNHIFLKKEDVQFLVKLSPDQYSPFEQPQQIENGHSNRKDLADYLVLAQNYWQHQICEKISFQNLLKEGFSLAQLDISKKGSIKAEDLVCFINLYCQTFYLNRDVSLIFKRFQLFQEPEGDFINFESIQKAFAN